MEKEFIVFVDNDGKPTGETGPKLASHNEHTKLHLAFSCYIFNTSTHDFLLTQRAHGKKVWPTVWTNSVCGHPMPGEPIEDAIRRRTAYEIGLDRLEGLDGILPHYVYKTPPYNGIIEHEFCPIYVAFTDQEPTLNPDEVDACRWLSWSAYDKFIQTNADEISYWAKDEYPRIAAKIETILA
jgi:isopentenyl-diphosphate Delta-isomerase